MMMTQAISKRIEDIIKRIPEEKLRALLEEETTEAADEWQKWGARLPKGTLLRMWHPTENRPYWAEWHDFAFHWKGQTFLTLEELTKEIIGRPKSIWETWEVKLPGRRQQWRSLKDLRTKQSAKKDDAH